VWGPPPTRVVRIADLDLSRDAGQQTLRRRVKLAVAAVCGEADLRDFGAVRAVKDCRSKTLRDVTPQVDAIIARWRPGQRQAAIEISTPLP